MRTTEYKSFSEEIAGHVSTTENTLSRRARRNQARNLARAEKKRARANYYTDMKKVVA